MILTLGLWTFLRVLVASATAIALENTALRHQLLVLHRTQPRPALTRVHGRARQKLTT